MRKDKSKHGHEIYTDLISAPTRSKYNDKKKDAIWKEKDVIAIANKKEVFCRGR